MYTDAAKRIGARRMRTDWTIYGVLDSVLL